MPYWILNQGDRSAVQIPFQRRLNHSSTGDGTEAEDAAERNEAFEDRNPVEHRPRIPSSTPKNVMADHQWECDIRRMLRMVEVALSNSGVMPSK